MTASAVAERRYRSVPAAPRPDLAAPAPPSCAELIEYHTQRYFVDDDPEITDAEFDALVAELAGLERHHPELAPARLADSAGRRASRHAVRRGPPPSRR